MSIGVGFLGVGWIAEKVHLPYFLKQETVKRIACYDPNPARLETLRATEPDLIGYDSIEELLADNQLQLIVISTPNHLHAEQIIMSLKAGKKVFCEKPICTTRAEADLLEPWLKKHSGDVFVGLPNRFREDIQRMQDIVRQNELGRIYRAKGSWLRQNGIPRSGWFLDKRQAGGGVLIDLGSHVLDLLLCFLQFPSFLNLSSVSTDFFLNDPQKYAGWHGSSNSLGNGNVEDNITAMMKNNDLACLLVLGWAGHNGHDETVFELHGDKGRLQLQTLFGFSQNTKCTSSTLIWDSEIHGYQEFAFDLQDRLKPYWKMWDIYLAEIESGSPSEICPHEALHSIRLIHDIYNHCMRR